MFKAVNKKMDAKLQKTNALGTLEVRNLAICLCHIFGGGKRADTFTNMLVSEFDKRKEVDSGVQISVFKHKTAQSYLLQKRIFYGCGDNHVQRELPNLSATKAYI